MTTFDLSPYGMNIMLKPDFDFNRISELLFMFGSHRYGADNNVEQFIIGGTKYDVLETMGSGTYGTTYRTQSRKDGKEYAIKHIHGKLYEKRDLIAFAKESIMQILVAEESKDQPTGPYVPMIYEIAYNSYRLNGYIRSELMRNTFHNLASASTPESNDIIVPDALSQIAVMLRFLGERLQFNHRDLKADNIMYIREGTTRVFKLIDFGFSCLTWNGLKINGGDYFAASPTCFKNHRDLSQLMYYMMKYFPLSTQLRQEFTSLLNTNVRSKKCVLSKSCGIDSWADTYNFLNRANVVVPRGNPDNVYDTMDAFQHPLPIQPPIAVPEPTLICPPGEIINPKTSRCVKETGAVGAIHMKNVAAPEDCPPGKIINPKTRRCVKVDGSAGKSALKNLHISNNVLKPLQKKLSRSSTRKNH